MGSLHMHRIYVAFVSSLNLIAIISERAIWGGRRYEKMGQKRKSGVAGFDSAFYCGVGCDNDVGKMVRSVVSMDTTRFAAQSSGRGR